MITTKVTIETDLNYYRRGMKPGKVYRLTLEVWRRKRTLDQNAFWHVLIKELGHKTGCFGVNQLELIKEGLKLRAMNERGYPKITYDGITYPQPSHNADTVQMGLLIDLTFDEAAEQGIDLSGEWHEWQDMKGEKEVL